MNLYKYKEILENINIIVIFSIPIISLILYTLNKRKVMILENLIYIGEFFIYLYLNSYIIIGNINLIIMILILKFVIILTLKEKLKINNFLYKFILILGLLYVCNIKVEYSILINIILNIIILKCSIIDCIKLFNKELLDNRHDLNQKKSYIKEVKKKIKSEKELQKNYKDEILGVSNKISKSIEESDIPIFILDINKKFIYSNEAFNMLIQDYKNKENRIDISKYLQFKFPKYKNLMDEIKKIATEARGNLNIKSYDGKIYRLECITDIIDERPVIVCILKDITQTTLIQNKLEESENMYKNLMDVLNEGVIIHDNKNIKYINDKITWCDAMIITSPVYSLQISGQLKNFIDHMSYNFHRPKYFNKKALIITTTGGVRAKEIANYIKEVLTFWGINTTYKLPIVYRDNNL